MGAETQRIGNLLIRFGMLDEEKLRCCLSRQQQLRLEGRVAPIGDVAVELGFLPAGQVQRLLAHQGPATLRCPRCGHRYSVPDFQPNRKYKCGDCKIYLAFPSEGGAPKARAPAAPPPAPLKKDPFQDRVFGEYRLVGLVGKGGMGAVYRAEHVERKNVVAVKILAEEFGKMPEILKRFKREAVAGGRLEHPNIAQVYDLDRHEEFFYIVSELVDGTSLERVLLKEKRLAPDRAVSVMQGILAGLQHAHEHGIIHRDIKPANILLTPDDRPKLIDFGIAKDADAQTVLTMAGTVLGSPSYMSPEQAQGGEIGPPTDLYSCGVVLFAMLTGRKPFEGKNLVETLSMHVRQPVPSLRAIRPEIPEAVERVVHRMMAKEPEPNTAPT